MLQRNPGPTSLVLPTLDPPVEVLPGHTIDHDGPLAGFEPAADGVEEPGDEADPTDGVQLPDTPDEAPDSPRARRSSRASALTTTPKET